MPNTKKRILCVDDNPDTCGMISFLLRDYEVVCVSTAAEGRRQAESRDFALIILDYLLPDGTGAALCSKIRSYDRRTPILFITGTLRLSETDARRLGANGMLQKGRAFFVDELRERVMQLAIA